MRILVVGARGNMGVRYSTILRYLKEDVLEADQGDAWWRLQYDRAIIATPTSRHIDDLEIAIHEGKPILCEKPICKDSEDVEALSLSAKRHGVDARMVCNWKYAINLALMRANNNKGKVAVQGEMAITYNYFNSGRDGFCWDMIQPIYLAGVLKYDLTYPAFEVSVDGVELTQRHFDESYVLMLSEWLNGDPKQLWSLEDATRATRKVEASIPAAGSLKAGLLNFADKGISDWPSVFERRVP